MKKKILPKRMLASFASLLFLMTLMPRTTRAQNTVSTTTTTETITKTSTVYVGEVVVDGVTKTKYLYSKDFTLYYDAIQHLHDCLNGMADGDYAALLDEHEFDFTIDPVPNGFTICSNPDLVTAMDENWNNASYVGTLYYPEKHVSSEINSNLYDIDEGFKAVVDAQNKERKEDIDSPADAEKCVVFHIDSRTTTDVYYTIEDGQVVRHVDITIIYDCEVATVVYTKVELNSSGEETGITTTNFTNDTNNTWYSIEGLELSGKPTAKGIYINNGKKIIIK